jgi:hypothetical protein
MSAFQRSYPRDRKAFAYVLALILLAVFMILAVVYTAAANLSLRSGHNYGDAVQARLSAESGLAFALHAMERVRLPGSVTSSTFPGALSSALGGQLNGTANLAGQTVGVSGGLVVVPEIASPVGQFACRLAWVDEHRASLTVKGSSHQAAQRVQIHMAFVPRQPEVFDYGLASKGQITIFGNAQIVGVNYPGEASILSSTQTHSDAIVLSGSVTISGDLYTSGDGTYVAMTGSPTVAGSEDPNVIAQHIHLGMEVPDFPEVDIAPIAALATNVLSTSNPKADSYSNIRIAANTNPTFNSDVVLNGVVYVEAPNVVKFNGHATVNGLIVAQGSGQPLDLCQITFAGNVRANGVEALPDTPEFAVVKQQTGTFIAAPGFGLTFSGNVSVDNGSMAADQLTFTGSAEGIVHGSVIGLKDLPTSVGGSVEIYVDRQNADDSPAGFIPSIALVPVPSSYLELKGAE